MQMETFSKESWALTSLIMVDELQSWWFLIVIVVIPYDKTNAGSSPVRFSGRIKHWLERDHVSP